MVNRGHQSGQRPSPIRPTFDIDKKYGKITVFASPGATTINQAFTQQDPTGDPTWEFSIHFWEEVTGFLANDVQIVYTGGTGNVVKNLLGSGADYTLQVRHQPNPLLTGLLPSLEGTITATIAAGVCIGVSGDPNLAATSTDNVITYVPLWEVVAALDPASGSRAYNDMVRAGDHLYVTENNQHRLISIDISNPEAPTISQILTPITGGTVNAVNPQGIDASGNRVFVSSVWQARAIDVNDPENMIVLGTTVTDSVKLDRANILFIGKENDANYAYVVNTFSNRVTVVGFSTSLFPTPPVQGSVQDATNLASMRAIAQKELHVLVGTTSRIVVIYIGNKDSIAIAAVFPFSMSNINRGSMLVVGNTLVVASSQLHLFDVTDPVAISFITSFTVPNMTTNFSQNGAVWTLAHWDGNIIAATSGLQHSGMYLIDISDPASPVVLTQTPELVGSIAPNRLLCDPPYAYMLRQDLGVFVVKYTGPTAPHVNISLITSFRDDLTIGPLGMALDGNVLWLCAYSDSRIVSIDVSDPLNLSVLGSVQAAGVLAPLDGCNQIALYGNTAFVSTNRSILTTIDITDPSAPVILDSYNTWGGGGFGPTDIEVDSTGTYAFMTGRDPASVVSLFSLDVSDPTNVVLLDNLQDAVQLDINNKLILDGDILYVGSSFNGYLTVVDVSDPSNLSIITHMTEAQTGVTDNQGWYKHGDYIFIPSFGISGLTAIDVSIPASPFQAGVISDPVGLDGVVGMAHTDNYAYLFARMADQAIVPISIVNPAAMEQRPQRRTYMYSAVTNFNNMIRLGGNLILIPDPADDVIYIFEMDEP